jgi:cardiolipin synthase
MTFTLTAGSLKGVTRRGVRTLAATVAVAVWVGAALSGCGGAVAISAPPAGASAYQLIQEPDEGYAPIVDLLDQARRSIRVTMYELADPAATNALIAAHGRGVDVKVLLDAAFHGRETNTDAYDQLSAAGVGAHWAPDGVIYHQKTITVDDARTAVGTGNLQARYYPTSRDAWVIDSDPGDVAAVAATFDADYTAAPGGHPPAATTAPALVWSPAARATFLQLIDNATRSVDVTSEELKDRAVVRALDDAAQRGVACRVVMTANPAWTKSIHEVAAAGCSVHLFPDGENQLYMHEKILLADRTALIIGSQNLTATSLLENRELSLQLDTTTAPNVVAAVATTFDNDYNNAPPAA